MPSSLPEERGVCKDPRPPLTDSATSTAPRARQLASLRPFRPQALLLLMRRRASSSRRRLLRQPGRPPPLRRSCRTEASRGRQKRGRRNAWSCPPARTTPPGRRMGRRAVMTRSRRRTTMTSSRRRTATAWRPCSSGPRSSTVASGTSSSARAASATTPPLGKRRSPPPMRTVAEKGKAFPPLWSPRDGSVVVASFYLPVTLTKTKTKRAASRAAVAPVSSASDHDAAGTAAADCPSADGSDGDDGGEGAEDVWTAEWDYEQLIALQTNLRVVRVGTVKCAEEIGEDDKAAVASALLKLNCVPLFLAKSLTHQCYYTYCKGVLWPVLHGMLEMYDDFPNCNSILDDKALTEGWQAYKQVNRAFRDKIVEVFHEGDMVWIHGFHLAILPAFLGRTVKVARIGLFLHTPFPPSEVFRVLPHREDLLRGMLGADQVGFHRFSDSRHFMYSCRRLLGLTHLHSQETGVVQIVHGGKPTILTDRHAGIDPEAVRASLREEGSKEEVARLKALHGDRVVVAGVERVEKIKGVWLKMLAFEDVLQRYPHLVGRVSMHEVGIANPARGSDYRACQEALSELAGRMNAKHGEGTVIYEERDANDATLAQRAALMSVASVFVKTPVHNGLSMMPMEFRVVQEHRRSLANDNLATLAGAGGKSPPPSPGVLILSEAVSCSPVLRGSFSVNPWQVQAVADAIALAVEADDDDRTAWHEEDADWCESNTTAKWAEDVLGVLTTVPKENRSRYATTGLGLTSRVVGTDPTFKRLDTSSARRAYGLSKQRVFFLDYGGTLVKDTPTAQYGATRKDNNGNHHSRRRSKGLRLLPGRAVLEGLSELCRDPCNTVFVISGRGKDELQEAFGHIKELGLAAEHGSFFRWPATHCRESNASRVGDSGDEGTADDGWEALHPGLMNTAWKAVARRFMQDFQMHTHGSYIEEKGTAILWHYGDAEPEFGAMQAKQLQDELTDVLRSSAGPTNTAPVEGVLLAGAGAGGGGICPAVTMAAGIGEARGAGNVRSVSPGLHAHRMVLNGGVPQGKNVNMNSITTSVSTTAITGSTRSTSSVASESLGGIDITHEEGRNSVAGGGGAYLEVRARGASKGSFVHMVMDRLGWQPECPTFPDDDDGADDQGDSSLGVAKTDAPGGRFCLCVGDDVSDEDMFIAAKSYERAAAPKERCQTSATPSTASPSPCSTSSSSGKENLTPSALPTGRRQRQQRRHQQQHQQQHQQEQQQESHLLTVTVGSKPSDADAWLPGVDAVVSLLRVLGRMTSPDAVGHRSKFAAYSAGAAISNSSLLEATPRGESAHSVSPTRCWRSASASNTDADATASSIKGLDMSTVVANGRAALDSVPGVTSAVGAMNLGQGVPVMRRHSYTIGGKPRISLSLSEFLNSVAQPEPEPPSF
ncbi:unnamed protein product [Scytosiphon promiscuus]